MTRARIPTRRGFTLIELLVVIAIIGRSFYPGMDLDLNGKNEENGGPTFAAITSRSYHPGGVNALLGDGSVKFVKGTVDGMVWRALGTVAGGEVVGGEAY